MPKKVFISYQRHQESQIKDLAALLTQTGNFEVWFDKNLKVGEDWWDEILNHIETADIVILALSPTYLTSEACNLEWKYAHDYNKTIIPLQVEQSLKIATVHEDIRRLQITPYYGIASEFLKLQSEMNSAKSKPPSAIQPARPPAPMDMPQKARLLSNSTLIVGALVVIALIIAAGVLLSQRGNSPSATRTNLPSPAGEAGSFDLTLIFGGQDSLTVKLNNDSHLTGLTLETSINTETIADQFTTLANANFIGSTGSCLRYIREGANPALPLGCKASSALSVNIRDPDIFWYSSDGFQMITLKQAGVTIGQPCDPADGFGRCDFKVGS